MYSYKKDMEQDDPDFLSKEFWAVFYRRFLPVISLSFVIAVFALSVKFYGVLGFYKGMTLSRPVYGYAALMTLWVSIPSFIWLCLRNTMQYKHWARPWYLIMTGFLVLTNLAMLLLYPEWFGAMRLLMVVALPLHALAYIFLCVLPLGSKMAHSVNTAGMVTLLYGVIVWFIS